MQRPSVNYLIDLATLLAVLAIACTGLIMRFVLPPGSGQGGRVLWGLGRHDWGSVHFWITVAAGTLLAIHLVLHWPWVCTVTSRVMHPRGRVRPPTAAARQWMGAAFLVGVAALLIGFTLVARSSVSGEAGWIDRRDGAGEPLSAGRERGP